MPLFLNNEDIDQLLTMKTRWKLWRSFTVKSAKERR